MKKQYFLTLMCREEHIQLMEEAIEASGFEIKPGFPLSIHNSNGDIAYRIFELDVILNPKDDKQGKLLELQDKYCF